jgi:hypothetical protein
MVGDDQKNRAYHLATIEPPKEINDYTIRQWAYENPRQVNINDILFVLEARGEAEQAQTLYTHAEKLGVLNNREPDWVNGNDVIELFPNKRPGKWLGQVLDKVREAQYKRDITDRASGIEWIKKQHWAD